MSEHTPGPWVIYWESCDCGGDYPCSHGRYPHHVYAPNKRVEHYGRETAAEIANFTEAEDVTDADARLIAAAPDLLEALKGLESIGRALEGKKSISPSNAAILRSYMRQARAALAKAKGEQGV